MSADAVMALSADSAAPAPERIEERSLSHGRSVLLRLGGDHEEIQVRSPGGDVELRITFTADGPVATLRGGKLNLEAVDSMTLDCKNLDVRARESAAIDCGRLDVHSDANATIYSEDQLLLAAREARVLTSDDILLNGAMVRMQSP